MVARALSTGTLVPAGPVVIGIDETIERRWGPKITARGISRDPVRSGHGHFVKASGLRWISVMLLAPIPWAGRVWALPFLTALAPSQRYAHEQGRRHKPRPDLARQLLSLVARWLPGRRVIAVADSTYAAIELLAAIRRRLWDAAPFPTSPQHGNTTEISRPLLDGLIQAACFPA